MKYAYYFLVVPNNNNIYTGRAEEMKRKMLILLVVTGIVLFYSFVVRAERTTSVGFRALTSLNEVESVFYGPAGTLDLTENVRVRGSYLVESKSYDERIGFEGLYLYNLDLLTAYIGGGVNMVELDGFLDFVAGLESYSFFNFNIYLEGIYSLQYSPLEAEKDRGFRASTGVTYSF